MTTIQERLPMTVPRARGWCPASNCHLPCGPGICQCKPCFCMTCRARHRKAVKGRPLSPAPRAGTVYTPYQPSLLPSANSILRS